MTRPLTVTGLAGSLRAASHSRSLLTEMVSMLPPGTNYEAIDIGALPHYNEDLEAELPASVTAARARVASSDAVLIVTPEFNHGVPGVLKNTLDWLSRPAFTSCFQGKPVLFATHSPGALGGVRAQYQMRETLASMLCQLVPLPEIAVTHVAQKLDGERLVDAPTRAHIAKSLAHFFKVVARG